MIFNPYALLGLLVALLITFGTGYHNGYKHADDRAAALTLQAVEKAKKKAIEQAKADFETAQRYEKARETVRTVYVTIKEKAHENIEKHPDYANCGLDADGLRLYNHNPNTGASPATGLDGHVPGLASSPRWQIGDDPEKQPGTLGNVLHLPGAAQSIVGMGDVTGRGGWYTPKN